MPSSLNDVLSTPALFDDPILAGSLIPVAGLAALLSDVPPPPLPPDEQPAAAASKARPATVAARPPARPRGGRGRKLTAFADGAAISARTHDSDTSNSLASGQGVQEARRSAVHARS